MSDFAGGDGSEENPYEIENWYHLDNIRNHLGDENHFQLNNDLDENTDGYDDVHDSTYGFQAIGIGDDAGTEFDERFDGHFDGQGYAIRDLWMDKEDRAGLFGSRDISSSVQNLIIDNWTIESNEEAGTLSYADRGDTINVIVANTVVDAPSSGTLSQENHDDSDVERVYVLHNVDVLDSSEKIGGLYGHHRSSAIEISDSYSAAFVDDPDGESGALGESDSTVTNLYWDTEASQNSGSADGTGLTTSEMQGSDAETNMNLDFNNDWDTVEANTTFTEDGTEYEIQDDGYPILQSLSTSKQLDAQDVDYQEISVASVQTDPATNVDFESAQLNGEVTALDEETEVEAYFQYRETGATEWIETTKQTISDPQTYDETVTELDDDTEYEVRAVIDDTGGETLDTGDTLTFTTDVKQTGSVSTDPALNVSDDSAQLNGELTDLGDYDEADVGFSYRETGAADWIETEFDTVTETGAFDETVSGLEPETEYEFKAVADFDGEEETGDALTFTTEEESDAVEITEKSPLDQSEYLSETTRFEADIEFNEDGDYYIDIEIDDERVYREEFNNVTAGQTETVETNIEIGFKTYDWDWVGQKQVDGE